MKQTGGFPDSGMLVPLVLPLKRNKSSQMVLVSKMNIGRDEKGVSFSWSMKTMHPSEKTARLVVWLKAVRKQN